MSKMRFIVADENRQVRYLDISIETLLHEYNLFGKRNPVKGEIYLVRVENEDSGAVCEGFIEGRDND